MIRFDLMSFVCKTSNCAISISGASFPAIMNCPVCQILLTEKNDNITLTEIEELIIQRLPYTIAYPLKRAILEKYAWSKINLLKDTFLNYLKYLGLITASDFFNSSLKDKKMVTLFYQSLAEPSFGSWNQYIRETIKFLKENNHVFFCKDLVDYYETIETGKKRKLYKGEIQYIDDNGDMQLIKQEATGIGMLINFRNRYLGHGLTLDEDDSLKLWNDYYPFFLSLLEQMTFTQDYPMYKFESGDAYLLKSSDLIQIHKGNQKPARVWIENREGESMDILPFFVVPGEVSIEKEDKVQLLTYESYTGRTIKFFSPEGTEKQTSGKILEKLNLLLREKQKEIPFTPDGFSKDEFLKRIAEENKLLLDTLIAEKKIIPGIYQHREEMEIKLREWIGARASIFFIIAEAGSGKTNLLVEIQRQYTERNLPSLLIRAGRMEKHSLKQQIQYLLNLDFEIGIENYISIAGTQAEPTFILIDGLNEANNAEEIWQEIIDLSKIFVPGSLKFVVTNRANTKSELNRYTVSEKDQDLLFGENKDNETGLSAFSYWLTALDMKEMKGAWANYVIKDKAKYNPKFNFDTIAEFDRGLYNQINNPLILRLFLEIYNGKVLPQKGIKYLNIWQDWFKTFSEPEQIFLKLLANEIWEKGQNELLLDDLLKHDTLKSYFTSDIINAPYNRLKNIGWISRYVKDLNGYVSFTVEGSLLHLLALKLQAQNPVIEITAIQSIMSKGTELQKSAIESFLCEKAVIGDLSMVIEIIDTDWEDIDLCINPLLLYTKAFGVKVTIEKVLENATENDWKVLNKLEGQLEELQLHTLRKEFLIAIMPLNEFKTKSEIRLGLSAIAILDKNEAQFYYEKIDTNASNIIDDDDLLSQLGKCEQKFGKFDEALGYFEKCLTIRLRNLGGGHPDVANSYNHIGIVWKGKGEYDNALQYYEKCLIIRLKNLGDEHTDVAKSYNNIGIVWMKKGKYDKALEYYEKSLEILIKTLGGDHPHVASSYNNIGNLWSEKDEYDNALEYHEKCLKIRLKNIGDWHPYVASSYMNIGNLWKDKGEYDKSLEYFGKSLEILIKSLGGEHPSLADLYNNIGNLWKDKGEYDNALEYHEKCLTIRLKNLGDGHPDVAKSYTNIGVIWKEKGEYDKALESCEKSQEIFLTTFGLEHQIVAVYYYHIGSIWNGKVEYDKALEFYEKSLMMFFKTLGRDHPSLANLYENIGLTRKNKGEYDKALDNYEKCLAIRLKTFGGEHLDVASSYYNFGDIWNEKGEYGKALELFNNCYRIRFEKLGPKHALTIEVSEKISSIKSR